MAWSKPLFIGAMVAFGIGVLSGQPADFVIPAMILAAGGFYAGRGGNRNYRHLDEPSDVQRRMAEIEQRLALTEGELASANTELEQLRAEREFDRQLLRKAANEEPPKER